MISEIIFSTLLSLTPAEKGTIKSLETRLKKEGYNISSYIKDPRFEIYKFKGGGKAKNYADTTQSWYMKKDSLEKCADFIEEYYHYLKKTQEEHGPSPEHLTSQLELETNRGQFTGKYPVINALISMYLNREDRRKEFYIYLKDFLDLFRDTTDNIILPEDIFEIKGSWAGAIGNAQGMSSIIKKYGKYADGDGDGKFDPMNMPDAIKFLGLIIEDNGYKKSSFKATQRYNPGDKFYGSAIGKHIKALEKIMETRSKIPPEKVICNIKPAIANIQYPPRDNIQESKIFAMAPEPLPKQPFIKRILQNRRNGRRG
ncbi:MAG: lytic murein transglycosylase [Nanobdellota archaeon]